jgi:hypothetical protein
MASLGGAGGLALLSGGAVGGVELALLSGGAGGGVAVEDPIPMSGPSAIISTP